MVVSFFILAFLPLPYPLSDERRGDSLAGFKFFYFRAYLIKRGG